MKIVRSKDVPFAPALERGKYSNKRKSLAPAEAKIQAGMWELPPGKTSFPMHRHHVTEEAMFVVSGHATVRTPEGDTPIGPGDYVSFVAGGPAHQLVNEGTETLVYVALSTNAVNADIVEYPHSGKIAASLGTQEKRKRYIFREKEQADYFEGEE